MSCSQDLLFPFFLVPRLWRGGWERVFFSLKFGRIFYSGKISATKKKLQNARVRSNLRFECALTFYETGDFTTISFQHYILQSFWGPARCEPVSLFRLIFGAFSKTRRFFDAKVTMGS